MNLKNPSLLLAFLLVANIAKADDYYPPEYKSEDLQRYLHSFDCVQEGYDGVYRAIIKTKDWPIPLEGGGWRGIPNNTKTLHETDRWLDWWIRSYENDSDLPKEVWEEQLRIFQEAKRLVENEEETCEPLPPLVS